MNLWAAQILWQIIATSKVFDIKGACKKMKKQFLFALITCLLFTACVSNTPPATEEITQQELLHPTDTPTAVPTQQPQDLAAQLQEAINSGDTDSAIGLFSDDAVVHVDETISRTGKAEIEEWLASLAELNYRIEGEPVASESGVVFDSCTLSSDLWSYLQTNPMSGTCEMTLEGGLVTSFTIQYDQTSKTQLADSPAAKSGDLVAIWTAQGVIPGGDVQAGDVAIYYLQFGEDGNARLALSPDDLLTTPDSDHPGANLSWTYDDYVLTVRNDGAASEGYCQEQDLGRYMVKYFDDGEIQFKPIQDACSWRKFAFQRVGSSWDLYVP